MKSAIFIPEKMKVGFQNREGTFTGKLAYIIYYDNRGKLRKEKSWQGWRDKSIEPIDFANEPTEGFVLNKKVGGYDTGWNHRSTYCRIYDPRGYEFEINIENLLYILENTSSIKGKGLEGKFVYAMDGKDLILIPCDSPDYKRLKEFNDKLREGIKFNMKNMITGATYRDAKNRELVYVGRYEDYTRQKGDKIPKSYYFYDRNVEENDWYRHHSNRFTKYNSVGTTIIECIDETCCLDYADIFDDFEYYESYNPYDCNKDEYVDFTLESFTEYIESCKGWRYERWKREYINFFSHEEIANDNLGGNWRDNRDYKTEYYYEEGLFKWETYINEQDPDHIWRTRRKTTRHEMAMQEFFDTFKPQYKREYLQDGKLRKEIYNGER